MGSLNLWDISDRELLHVVDDELDAQVGYAHTKDIATRLGVTGKYPAHPTAIRLSWLVRFGLLDRHREHTHLWRLSRSGRALKDGDLTAEETKAINAMDPARIVSVTHQLTRRFKRAGAPAATMMRREWQRGTTPPRRKRGTGGE